MLKRPHSTHFTRPLALALALIITLVVTGRSLVPVCAKEPQPPAGTVAKTMPQSSPGTIRISPSAPILAQGQTITLYIWLEDIQDYYGVDLKLSFDPTVLAPDSGTLTPLWDVFDSANSFSIRNQVNPAAGTAWYAVTNVNPAEPFSGTGRVCAIGLRALRPGNSVVDIYYAKGGTRDGASLYPVRTNALVSVTGDSERPYQLDLPVIVAP